MNPYFVVAALCALAGGGVTGWITHVVDSDRYRNLQQEFAIYKQAAVSEAAVASKKALDDHNAYVSQLSELDRAQQAKDDASASLERDLRDKYRGLRALLTAAPTACVSEGGHPVEASGAPGAERPVGTNVLDFVDYAARAAELKGQYEYCQAYVQTLPCVQR